MEEIEIITKVEIIMDIIIDREDIETTNQEETIINQETVSINLLTIMVILQDSRTTHIKGSINQYLLIILIKKQEEHSNIIKTLISLIIHNHIMDNQPTI